MQTKLFNTPDIDEEALIKYIKQQKLEKFKKLIQWKPPTQGFVAVFGYIYRKRNHRCRGYTIWQFARLNEYLQLLLEKKYNRQFFYTDNDFSSKDELLKFCRERNILAIYEGNLKPLIRECEQVYKEVCSNIPCPICGGRMEPKRLKVLHKEGKKRMIVHVTKLVCQECGLHAPNVF
jgi:YgiT-type zinc finger domain-containing protein